MSASINSSEVLSSIRSYIENNDRPCPAHYLTDKFGDDVAEVLLALKAQNLVIGRRGRNGGIVFPDTVFKKSVKTPAVSDSSATV